MKNNNYLYIGLGAVAGLALLSYGKQIANKIGSGLAFNSAVSEAPKVTEPDRVNQKVKAVVDFCKAEIAKEDKSFSNQDEEGMVRELNSTLTTKQLVDIACLYYKNDTGRSFRADLKIALAANYSLFNVYGRFESLNKIIRDNLT